MNLITIDIGHYSIKFIESHIDKKNMIHDSMKETILDLDQINVQEENAIWDLQLRVVSEYLENAPEDYKLIINSPSEILTTRIKELPIANKKKAELMIPFQLEEDIPFAMVESHISATVSPKKQTSDALIHIARKEEFKPFFNKLINYNIKPRVLTSEVSAMEFYIKSRAEFFSTTFCILDLGHESTKAYFFIDGKLASTHTSFIAGKAINENISENYQIELEEAVLYKHQNCFVLTDDQYAKVDENQRTFAKFMGKTLEPLIREFKRWELGFRVKHGYNLNEVFITGGTSNIKNLHNYFTQELGIRVTHLNSFEIDHTPMSEKDLKFVRRFNTGHILSFGHTKPNQIINLLNDEFAMANSFQFPLDSLVLFSSRVAILSVIVFASLLGENFFIRGDISELNKEITPLMKNSALELTARQKRLAATDARSTYNTLARKSKMFEQKVSTLQSGVQINSLSTLHKLTTLIQGAKLELTQFSAVNMGDFTAVFKASSLDELKNVEQIIQGSSFKSIFIDLNEAELTMTVNGGEF